MGGREFHKDDAFQREIRNRILVPEFYGRRMNGHFVFMDKGRLANVMQRRWAVDTIAQTSHGEAVSIEEKIVRWKGRHYTAVCLETRSCTVPGREKTGWMEYGRADYLLYCFQQPEPEKLRCVLVEFQPLKRWFWPIRDRWPATETDQINKTRSRVVPIEDIRRAVPAWQFILGGGNG